MARSSMNTFKRGLLYYWDKFIIVTLFAVIIMFAANFDTLAKGVKLVINPNPRETGEMRSTPIAKIWPGEIR